MLEVYPAYPWLDRHTRSHPLGTYGCVAFSMLRCFRLSCAEPLLILRTAAWWKLKLITVERYAMTSGSNREMKAIPPASRCNETSAIGRS